MKKQYSATAECRKPQKSFVDFIKKADEEANKNRECLEIHIANLFDKHIQVEPKDVNDPLLERTLNDLREVFRIGCMCGWNDCFKHLNDK